MKPLITSPLNIGRPPPIDEINVENAIRNALIAMGEDLDNIEFTQDELNDPELICELQSLEISTQTMDHATSILEKEKKGDDNLDDHGAETKLSQVDDSPQVDKILDHSNALVMPQDPSKKDANLVIADHLIEPEMEISQVPDEPCPSKMMTNKIEMRKIDQKDQNVSNEMKISPISTRLNSITGSSSIHIDPSVKVIHLMESNSGVKIEKNLGSNLEQYHAKTLQKPCPINSEVESKLTTTSSISDQDIHLEKKTNLQSSKADKTFQSLESILIRQIKDFATRALAAKESGDKINALNWLRKRKVILSELELVRLAHSSSSPPPAFHIESKEFVEELINEDLSMDEMSIEILKLTSLKLELKKIGLYVECLVGYPDPKEPIQFTTPTLKNTSQLTFNMAKKIQIKRNKNFERFLKRKLIFKIYKAKSWFFGSPTLIGKAEIKLQELMEHLKVQANLKILLDGCRETKGDLCVSIRLRTPLCKMEMVSYTEKMLVIDKHFVDANQDNGYEDAVDDKDEQINGRPSDKPVKMESVPKTEIEMEMDPNLMENDGLIECKFPTDIHSSMTPSSNPISLEKDPKGKTDKKHSPKHLDSVTQKEPDYESLNWIVSHAVLEWMQEKLQQESVLLKKKAMWNELEVVNMKIQQLDIKSNMLIVQVQQGFLTPEIYRKMLEGKIQEELGLAQILKKASKVQEAKEALYRVMLMKKEMEEE